MAAKFDLFKDKGGQYRFNLKAANGQVVASSEAYTTKQSAENGIDAVKRAAGEADTEDNTGE